MKNTSDTNSNPSVGGGGLPLSNTNTISQQRNTMPTNHSTIAGGGGGQSLNNQSLENPKNAKGLDSKSKLESKNPNKIQTTKIQDSKIQLESNPKDFAKLESNSPKLKDSKVSKTSKDSMKLESSPKLDSKTSQKSNSKSKLPKIQRAKNTCDSKQSKKPTKSKNSSKLKSFIRTIPISIALASALSSQAVAEWYHVHKPGNQETKTIINNGTINQNLNLTTFYYISLKGTTDTTNLTINYDLTGGGDAAGGPQNGLITLDSANEVGGTITNNANFSVGGSSKRALVVNNRAILKSFVNNASLKHTGSNSLIYVRAGGTIQNITNNGEMSVAGANQGWKSVIRLEDSGNLTGSRVDAINFIGTSTTSNVNGGTKQNVISIGSATSSIGTITARDNATIDGNFSFDQGTIRNITFQDSANMTGDISLANSAKITNGITIGGNSTGGSGNNATLTGNISLTNNSRIQGGIVLDSANMTGNISLSTASNRDNITIDSINIGNGSTMTGNISLSTANGGGNITIDSINIGNGSTMTGDISVLGNSKITDSITIAGTLDGNVSAIHRRGGSGTINQMDISGEITKKVQLDNKAKIATLNLNGGTITEGIAFQGTITNDETSTIDTLTLSGAAHIGGIDIGNTTSGSQAKGAISTLTLEGTSSIGSIVNNIGTISTLTLGGTSSIGTITNNSNGTISNIALNGTSTITNGITNASGGTISNITLASSNTIHNGITNNGVITEINHNVAGVENAVTNNTDGSISRLIVSQGTIEYNGDGIVTEEIRVEGGATLSIAGGAGMITLDSNTGSKLNLLANSTFQGSLKNAGSISTWNNVSNIDGSFINASGASVVDLIAGEIRDNLLNEGEITNLTINKNIGTLTNDNGGVINTLIIQDSSVITSGITNNASSTITTLTINDGANVTGGITNNSNIGSLNLQENVTYDGSGSITNALDIAGSKTLNASTNGIKILFANGATGTIDNAGIISGNLNNQNGSTIKTFNTGSISGSIANDATIQELNVTGNVTNGITNDSNIANLNVNSNVTYAGNGSITNALDINGAQTQFTISNGAGNTLTLAENANTANSVKTITNDGTIIGNLINDLTSTNWAFGVLQGNFTNNGSLTALTDTGSITGILTNGNKGIINTLNTSKVGGSIANNGNLVNVIVDSNKTLTGNGSITNALDIANNKTLTATNNGIKILFANGATGTINNAGIISGNLNNQNGSTIKSFNTGSISGNLTNNASATIETLNVTSNVGSIANSGEINTLTIQSGSNIANGITNDSNIAKLNVSSNVSYSGDNGNISQELVINQGNGQTTTFTIQGTNQTLTLGGTGNGGVKTITNEGTIIGNLINTLSTNWIGGTLEGDFTNNSNAILQSLSKDGNAGTITGNLINAGSIVSLDSGTIRGSLDNQAGGIINTLHSSVVGNLSNAGVVKDFIVDRNMDYTGNGSITNSMTILNNNTLNIGNAPSNGTININFGASATGTIGNNGIILGSIDNQANSIIKTFNTGSISGNLTNKAGATIKTLNVTSNVGSIANSGNINTLNVTGNVTNGITNEGNITTLINNQANTSITNSQNIGTLDINANTTYSGAGNITNEINVESGDTLTIGSGSDTLNFHATNGTINNAGTIKGTINNIKGSSILDFDNSGSITGIINNGHIVEFTNNASGIIDNFVNKTTISFFENNGVIKDFSGNGIIYGVLNSKEITGNFENVATSLQNTGTITGNVQLIGNQKNCDNEICKNSDLINTGTIGDVANNTGGTIINQKDDVLNSISNGEENGVDSAIIVGNVENSGEIKDIINYNNGTIQGIINNKDADSIIGKIQNTGVMGGISNAGNITTINTGSITGSIANSGEITTLKVTGNVTNGITNDSNITNLTIDKGVNLGSGITNNAAIGNFTNNANITYGGSGSITGNFSNAKDSTITLNNNNLILNGNGNAFNNDGILKGTISNIGALASFTNTGSITGLESGNITGLLSNSHTGMIDNLVVDGNVSQMQNVGNIADAIIKSEITNGIINGDSNYKQATIGKLDIQASLGSNGLQNAGTITSLINNFSNTNLINAGNIGSLDIQKNLNYSGNGSITDSIDIASNTTLTTNGITLKANNGSVNNLGTLAGILTLEGSSNSITNSGSITTIINNANNSSLTNNSNIGSLAVNENLTYNGNGSDRITQALEVAKDKTLTATNGITLNATKGNVNNLGILAGNLTLKGSSNTLSNAGTIKGNLTNSANTSTIANSGSINGTIINNATNGTIINDNNSNIAALDINESVIYNQGTNANITSNIDIAQNKTLKADYGITLNATKGSVNNEGILAGALTLEGSSNSITNSGSITTIINNANNSSLTNNSNIGALAVNENLTYNGNGSDRITQALEVAKDKTLTATNGITLHATKGSVNNLGILAGNLTLKGSSNTLSNAGTIKGNLTNSANTSTITNSGSINGTIINNATNGTIINANNSNIVALDINESVIYNQGTNANITSNIDIAQNKTLTADYGITLNANKGSVNNEGILAGALTLEGSSNSITNSGSITTIINNAKNSILTNDSNIGSLEVNKNLNYSGSGSITNYAIIAENTTLNNSTALIFASNNQGLENKGIITGLLENKGNMQLLSNSGTTSQINGDITNSGLIANLANQGTISGDITNNTNSTITSFINSGTISGNLYNDGHIDTLTNTGTMGTIYNTSKNTIENLINDKNSVIAEIDNSNGRYDSIQNQGTILGDIKNNNGTITKLENANNGTITGNINNNNGTITKLENANNGTITGQIISNGNSNIGTIANAGIINSSHTMNDSDIQNASNDAISLNTVSNVVTAIANSGSINGNVRVAGNSEVDLIQNSKIIAGCIILEGGKIGNINNTNGAIANCMSFSSGANVDNLNNGGTIKELITNDSGNITVNNSGSIGGITTSNGGNTTIINGGIEGNTIKPGGNIGLITNDGSNSNTHIDGWTLDNPENPDNAIKVAGDNLDGIHLKEDSIFVSVKPEEGKIYNYYDYIQNEKGDSIGDQFSQDDELFNALTFIDILKPTDNGDGTFSVGLDTKELSGKTLGASLIYSSRMRQIDTNNMLREINVKNFKTDFEILEQRERLKNQQALLENYKQQRESYLNGLTKDNKELKRVSSKESTSLSTYANNSNIKSDAIEVVDYYNKDTLASLDNLQATTKANQETYSNLDLLRELDDIFISHTGDKDNLYTFALPYTRYTSAQLDGGVGTLKSHASGILAGAQAKLPNERGILGIYFGYESSDKQVGQQRLDFDEKVYYGGLTYYNVFARKGVSEYYLSANTRIDKGDTDLYKTYRTGSTTINSQVDSYGYGADLKVGANYYNIYNNSVLSPEIGISYQGISTDSFRLRHLGGVSEHYYTQDVNFFDISASLRWQRAWNNVFKTMASLGAMYNVYNDAKGSGVIAGLKQSADINVEELYGTTQVGVSYALGENANIALNYSGIFANGVQSHAGYIRLGVWW